MSNPVLNWVCCVRDQLRIWQKITQHTPYNTKYISAVLLDSCLYYSTQLLLDLKGGDRFEQNVIGTLYKKCLPLQDRVINSRKIDYHQVLQKIRILYNTISSYVQDLLTEDDVLNDTITLLEELLAECQLIYGSTTPQIQRVTLTDK